MGFEETFLAFLPVTVLVAGIIAVLLADLVIKNTGITMSLTLTSLVGAMLSLWSFDGALPDDPYFFFGQFYRTFAMLGLGASFIVTIGIYYDFFGEKTSWDLGVLYSLMLLSNAGGLLIASSQNLIPLYIGFELMAIPAYGMIAYRTHDKGSSEAAMKIFLLGALATSITLFGISLLYGVTGSLQFDTVVASIVGNVTGLKTAAALMIASGISFKLGLIPFQWWISDVYAGGPVSVINYYAAASKMMGVAFAFQMFLFAVPDWNTVTTLIFAVLAGLTMLIGNMMGTIQSRVMRIMAYSSISHAGYLAVTIVSYGGTSDPALQKFVLASAIVHLMAIVLMKTASFLGMLVVIKTYGDDKLENFKGLLYKDKLLAGGILVALFSQMGIPPLAGFWGKALIVVSAIQVGTPLSITMAFIMILGSAISVYYYGIIVAAMVSKPSDEVEIKSSTMINIVLLVLSLLTVLFALVGFVVPMESLV